ncbi:MAG: hypothetical protein LAO04_17925 [Acidobacteriia bacterium]|nr:hypothetical protein [Terriglobia bacterium]
MAWKRPTAEKPCRGYQDCQNSDPADKAWHDRLVALVDRMLELNKKKHSGKLAPSEIDRLEREIASTDREIDELVYELYGITDEERKIIEGTWGPEGAQSLSGRNSRCAEQAVGFESVVPLG